MDDQLDMFSEQFNLASPAYTAKAGRPYGYYLPPGTGPDGKTCGDCRHLCRIRMGNTYLKCGLAKRIWTHGRRTDILAGAPACAKFEEGKDHQRDY